MTTIVVPAAIAALEGPARGTPIDGGGALHVVAGGALVAAGVVLVAHCIWLFVRLGGGTLAPWDPTRALVAEGAYRYARNPMKAGLFMVLLGEAIALRSSLVLVWFGCFVLVNVLYIRMHEEPGLLERFGEAYRTYCARVPRWLPSPWAAAPRQSRSRT